MVRENVYYILILMMTVLPIIAGFYALKSFYIDTYIIEGKVKAKFLAPSSEGTTYIVILENDEKLEIKRNFWYAGPQYNEDVLYAKIEVGKKYRFTCWGWKFDWGPIYLYPNIIAVEEVDE
ncbi:MAG: hypothetical protein QXN34_06900 [Archaeoglobaceae archaeon]